MKTVNKSKKNKKWIALSLIFITISFAIAHPFYIKYYKDPATFKKNCYNFLRKSENFTDADSQLIENYCDCVYKKLVVRYKSYKKFPVEGHFTKQDEQDIYDCVLEFLPNDSVKNSR
jgi:hypothetical protein